jgi:hypothetical protein
VHEVKRENIVGEFVPLSLPVQTPLVGVDGVFDRSPDVQSERGESRKCGVISCSMYRPTAGCIGSCSDATRPGCVEW